MKKRIAALLAACFLLLAGCGSSAPAQPFESGVVDALMESASFSEVLEVVDADIACLLYGIDETLVTDCTAYLSTGATAEEVTLFVLADEDSAETVKAACEKRVADQITAYESYGPAEVDKLEEAIIQVRANTVLLVVANDAAAAAQVVG